MIVYLALFTVGLKLKPEKGPGKEVFFSGEPGSFGAMRRFAHILSDEPHRLRWKYRDEEDQLGGHGGLPHHHEAERPLGARVPGDG